MDDISDDSPKESPTSRKTEPDSGLCTKGIEPQLKKLRSSFDGERDETNKFAEKSKPEKSRTTFKALGNVVLAMKRFQASLNPTYTYGKQQHVSASGTTSSSHGGLDTSGGGQFSFQDRGHRADLLLRPLPDVEDEVGSKLKDSK